MNFTEYPRVRVPINICEDTIFRVANPGSCWQVSRPVAAGSGTLWLNVRDVVPHGASGFESGIADACATAAAMSNGAGSLKHRDDR